MAPKNKDPYKRAQRRFVEKRAQEKGWEDLSMDQREQLRNRFQTLAQTKGGRTTIAQKLLPEGTPEQRKALKQRIAKNLPSRGSGDLTSTAQVNQNLVNQITTNYSRVPAGTSTEAANRMRSGRAGRTSGTSRTTTTSTAKNKNTGPSLLGQIGTSFKNFGVDQVEALKSYQRTFINPYINLAGSVADKLGGVSGKNKFKPLETSGTKAAAIDTASASLDLLLTKAGGTAVRGAGRALLGKVADRFGSSSIGVGAELAITRSLEKETARAAIRQAEIMGGFATKATAGKVTPPDRTVIRGELEAGPTSRRGYGPTGPIELGPAPKREVVRADEVIDIVRKSDTKAKNAGRNIIEGRVVDKTPTTQPQVSGLKASEFYDDPYTGIGGKDYTNDIVQPKKTTTSKKTKTTTKKGTTTKGGAGNAPSTDWYDDPYTGVGGKQYDYQKYPDYYTGDIPVEVDNAQETIFNLSEIRDAVASKPKQYDYQKYPDYYKGDIPVEVDNAQETMFNLSEIRDAAASKPKTTKPKTPKPKTSKPKTSKQQQVTVTSASERIPYTRKPQPGFDLPTNYQVKRTTQLPKQEIVSSGYEIMPSQGYVKRSSAAVRASTGEGPTPGRLTRRERGLFKSEELNREIAQRIENMPPENKIAMAKRQGEEYRKELAYQVRTYTGETQEIPARYFTEGKDVTLKYVPEELGPYKIGPGPQDTNAKLWSYYKEQFPNLTRRQFAAARNKAGGKTNLDDYIRRELGETGMTPEDAARSRIEDAKRTKAKKQKELAEKRRKKQTKKAVEELRQRRPETVAPKISQGGRKAEWGRFDPYY